MGKFYHKVFGGIDIEALSSLNGTFLHKKSKKKTFPFIEIEANNYGPKVISRLLNLIYGGAEVVGRKEDGRCFLEIRNAKRLFYHRRIKRAREIEERLRDSDFNVFVYPVLVG